MLRSIALVVAVALAGCNTRQEDGGDGHTHEHDHHRSPTKIPLGIKVEGDPRAGSAVNLRLTIPDADGKPVKDFAVSHDARVHLIVIREGLDQFAHLHPDVDVETGELTARHTFPVGGKYNLFADYQPTGGRPGTAVGTINVGGDSPPAPALEPDVPGTVSGDGISARVTIPGAEPGKEVRIRFELIDSTGKPATGLEPYMGAMGHLVVVSADSRHYVHAHPTDGQEGDTFAAQFPESGLYKGWGQFNQNGTVRVVPFVVRIP